MKMAIGKNKGKLYHDIFDLRDSYCFECSNIAMYEDNPDPNRVNKSCKIKVEPSKDNIKKALDDAKKDITEKINVIGKNSLLMEVNNEQEDALKTMIVASSVLNVWKTWFIEYFGDFDDNGEATTS